MKKVWMVRGDSMTPQRFWQKEWFFEKDVQEAKEAGFYIPKKTFVKIRDEVQDRLFIQGWM